MKNEIKIVNTTYLLFSHKVLTGQPHWRIGFWSIQELFEGQDFVSRVHSIAGAKKTVSIDDDHDDDDDNEDDDDDGGGGGGDNSDNYDDDDDDE